MAAKVEVSLETLAAIAGQGGASPELVAIQFNSNPSSVPERIKYGEAISPHPIVEEPPAQEA